MLGTWEFDGLATSNPEATASEIVNYYAKRFMPPRVDQNL